MSINTDFNLENNVKAPRKLLRTYVNLGTSETKEWYLLGKGIQESTIQTNFESETENDILGFSETTVKGAKPSQGFDPFTVRGGSKLAFMLHEIWLNSEYEKLSQFEILTVYKYIGSETDGYEADLQDNCTILFESLGGDAHVDMPITINYSDHKVRGTVTFDKDVPTFTPTAA